MIYHSQDKVVSQITALWQNLISVENKQKCRHENSFLVYKMNSKIETRIQLLY